MGKSNEKKAPKAKNAMKPNKPAEADRETNAKKPTEEQPLAGLTVLELASVLAGPSVGMFLAELGAEVIKVENLTTRGDVTRRWKLSAEFADTDISGYFSCVNWGKKSIALDLRSEEGLDLIRRFASRSDVVLVSFKPGDAEKLRVDYPELSKQNEQMIYAHVTGYGPENPRAGFDAIIQAESGFTYMNGEPDGPPVKMPVALTDVLAAHHMKEAVLLALLVRERTGKGKYIEASLFRSAISSLVNQATNWLVGGVVPERIGSDHPNIVPYGTIFTTSDGKEIVLAAGTDAQFEKLVHVLGAAELAVDERFAINQSRVAHKAELNRKLQKLLSGWGRDRILAELAGVRVPCGGVFNMKEVFELPEATPMMLHGTYPDGSEISGVRSVAFQNRDEAPKLAPPPHYGADSREILRNLLGLDDAQIQNLETNNVMFQAGIREK